MSKSVVHGIKAGRIEKKKAFIRKLAEFLAGPNSAKYSIFIQMGHESGKDWADLRSATPLFGYPTIDEAEEQLTKFLK